MNQVAQSIKQRLSLRPPQARSLEILANLPDTIDLQTVNRMHPTCTDFEHDFPSITFALATGVGKTRLMGAFISYLYLKKGIKNFFVVAPNLTIYNKLAGEFGDINHPKYVFRGISEFVHFPPLIVTGDNYNKHPQVGFLEQIRINIFNISKINAETRGGNVPRIKRLSEYLGDSYFNELAETKDLVLLMDESHHYRADRGMQVINELKPLLGLELTATPKIQQGSKSIKFKNVVYEYSLKNAIDDGFVKQPAVATRKNFNPDDFRDRKDELDQIKLEDGIRIHEQTKIGLELYGRNNNKPLVKPFMLVVARDTTHAQKLESLIRSTAFFNGAYADKVITVTSAQTGEEKQEVIEQLLNVESYENKVEIVIHVYMLKEGWDVTNLYTIIPLNAAGSETLVEQTLGRGLRLPYGHTTGDHKVDTLTIVAHDKFESIIDVANRPDSLIKLDHVIDIENLPELNTKKEVVLAESRSVTEVRTLIMDNVSPVDTEEAKKVMETFKIVAPEMVNRAIADTASEVRSIKELSKPEIKAVVMDNFKKRLENQIQGNFFEAEQIAAVEKSLSSIIDKTIKNTIEIPRIMIQPEQTITWSFDDFNLETNGLNLQPNDQTIMIQRLTDGKIELIDANERKVIIDSLENMITSELINFPEIDYDSHNELLFKLANQAINKLKSYLDENGLLNVIQYQRHEIAEFIYHQLMEHYHESEPEFLVDKVYPFDYIREHNFDKNQKDRLTYFRDTIEPISAIPSLVFVGFTKGCHDQYKFKSKTEKDFAILLEQDDLVLRWMIPAADQFKLYYDRNTHRYVPDFIVETPEAIYMVETKRVDEVDSALVQAKAEAGKLYCRKATEYTTTVGGKPWKYVIIPHSSVTHNASLAKLLGEE